MKTSKRRAAGRAADRVAEDVKVLFVTGANRSGTTLFHRLVGEIDGFYAVGEIKWLWWAYLNSDWQCGCREPMNRCPFWREVIESAFPGTPIESTVRRALDLQSRTVSRYRLPRLVAQRRSFDYGWEALNEWSQMLGRFYKTLANVTGAGVLVDSSKNASGGAMLRLVPGVDPYLVHLVRDPRGYANSMARPKRMAPHSEDPIESNVQPPWLSSLRWMGQNAISDVARWRLGKRSALVRYEDVVARPEHTLRQVARLVDEPFSGVEFAGDHSVVLHETHQAWGNPSRFETGAVKLRVDERWRTGLKPAQKLVATVVPAPFMVRYGYPLRSS